MTSKYYCPICGKDLHMTNDVFSICTNESCKIYTLPIPNAVSDYLKQIAQALIQSQEDLEIARIALREIAKEHTGTGGKLYACSLTAQQALEQIEHKENQ